MRRLPQSTAYRVTLKAFLAADHTAPATGKTIAVTLSKNGGAFGNPSAGATNATEISNGWYYVDLSTTDTNTLGDLVIRATESTIDPAEQLAQVVSATTGGMTALPNAAAGTVGGLPLSVDTSGRVDVLKINGTSQTARDIGASVLLSSGTGTGQLSIAAGVVSANTTQWGGTAVASATVRADLINIAGVAVATGTAQLGVNVVNWKGSAAPNMTGDAYARLGAPAGASVSADIAAVKADTATIISNQSAINTNVLAVAGNVWAVGTRQLTSGANIVLAKGTGITGFTDIDAPGVRAAVGLASANLDTAFASLQSHGDANWSGSDATTITKVDELHKLHGLDMAHPMTVTPTSRNVGSIAQAISGDGTTTSTVTRTA